MPQGLTTAPTNPAPRRPAGYIEALRAVAAQEKTIPFCIRWVRGFFAEYPGRRRRDLGRAEIEASLHKAAARPDVTNWQVQQARDALEVYYERFRGIALAPRPAAAVTHDAHPSALEMPGDAPGPAKRRQVYLHRDSMPKSNRTSSPISSSHYGRRRVRSPRRTGGFCGKVQRGLRTRWPFVAHNANC